MATIIKSLARRQQLDDIVNNDYTSARVHYGVAADSAMSELHKIGFELSYVDYKVDISTDHPIVNVTLARDESVLREVFTNWYMQCVPEPSALDLDSTVADAFDTDKMIAFQCEESIAVEETVLFAFYDAIAWLLRKWDKESAFGEVEPADVEEYWDIARDLVEVAVRFDYGDIYRREETVEEYLANK